MADHQLSRRSILDLAAAAAPLVLLASTLAHVADDDGMNVGEAAGTIQVWAFALLGIAAVVLTARLREAAPRLADAMLCLALIGVAGGAGYGIDAVQADVFGTGSLQDSDSSAVGLALQLPGLLFPLSFLVTAVMLARTGTAPGWAAVTLAVGAVLFPASRIPDAVGLAVVADVVLAAGMVGIVLPVGGRAVALREAG